jgi:hypothetical protein
MFISFDADILCVWLHWYIWSISSIRDWSIGIPRTNLGAVGNATFMLVREVSVIADMLKEVDAIVSLPIFDVIRF